MTNTTRARNKLARQTAPAAPAGAPAEPSVSEVIRRSVSRAADTFADVLPAGTDPERYARLVMTAAKSTPQLVECFGTPQGEQSVLLAAVMAATMGLEPNTPAQDCWLTPRWNGREKFTECQLTLGYRGKRKLMRRAGNIKTILVDVVREGDVFEWSRGFDEDVLVHEIPDPANRGPLEWVYAIARYHGGGHDAVRLHRTEVEDRRALSDTWRSEKARPYSPWTKHTADMWRKTAIHELAKVVDLEPTVARLLSFDEGAVEVVDGGLVPATYSGRDDEPAGLALAAPPADDPDEGKERPESEPEAGSPVDPVAAPPPAAEDPGQDPAPGGRTPKGPPPPIAPDRPVDEARMPTQPQLDTVKALLRSRRGAVGPQVPKVLTSILGRKLAGLGELTYGDACHLIETLEAETPEPAPDDAA